LRRGSRCAGLTLGSSWAFPRQKSRSPCSVEYLPSEKRPDRQRVWLPRYAWAPSPNRGFAASKNDILETHLARRVGEHFRFRLTSQNSVLITASQKVAEPQVSQKSRFLHQKFDLTIPTGWPVQKIGANRCACRFMALLRHSDRLRACLLIGGFCCETLQVSIAGLRFERWRFVGCAPWCGSCAA
jgi:hypothetical protein